MNFGTLGAGFGGLGRGGATVGYPYANAEAAAVVAAMSVEPADARKLLIDTLVGSLKTAGIWTKLDILYLLAAHDSQAALLNWKSPAAYTAIAVNSPTFTTDRGYTGNGTTSRLRTQYTPSTNGVNLVQNDASMWVWSRTESQGNIYEVGSTDGTQALLLQIRNVSDALTIRCNDNTGASTGATSNTSVGMFGTSRADSATKKAWRNGVEFLSAARTSVGVTTGEQWICGMSATNFSNREVSFAAWGASLTGLELSFYNAVLAYMQGVGAA